MWLPKPIYDALPYAYMGASLLTLVSINNFLGYASASLFGCAGALVKLMRG